jgi:uncharacterized protein
MRPVPALFLISIVSITLGAALPRTADAQAPAVSAPRPQIITSATGEAQLAPDRAAVYIGAQTRATSAAVAVRDNAQRQRAIIDALVGLGIPRSQISTEDYSVTPDTRFDPPTQKTTVTGYVVSNVVRVELQRIDQVGTVLDAALAKGANQINSLEFFASNSDSARHEAFAQAVSRARGDAEAIARAAGGTLGAVLEMASTGPGPRPVFRTLNASLPGPTPIEPGQQRVQVAISARFEYVPGRERQ